MSVAGDRPVGPLWSHLERLGGMLSSPRATVRRLLDSDEGRMWSVLIWLVVLGVALEPVAVGRALLLARVDVLGGLYRVANALSRPLAVPLAGMMGAAVLMSLASGSRRLPLDRALDVASHLLVPFLALAAFGAVMSSLGIEMWALPHRPLRGPAWLVTLRATVGFGASLLLLTVAVHDLRQRART